VPRRLMGPFPERVTGSAKVQSFPLETLTERTHVNFLFRRKAIKSTNTLNCDKWHGNLAVVSWRGARSPCARVCNGLQRGGQVRGLRPGSCPASLQKQLFPARPAPGCMTVSEISCSWACPSAGRGFAVEQDHSPV